MASAAAPAATLSSFTTVAFFNGGGIRFGNLSLRNSVKFTSNRCHSSSISGGIQFRTSIRSYNSAGGRELRPQNDSEPRTYKWPDRKRPRVCILGGGFGGLYTALRLESLVWPDEKKPQSLLKPPPHKFRPSCYTAAAFSTSKTNLASRAKGKVKSGPVASQVKRRTRSDRELDEESFLKCHGNDNCSHIPVMLGEVLDVFASVPLRSFVDCTLGAAGHSSAIIQAHNEMKLFVGIDVDPVAHEIADGRIRGILAHNTSDAISDLQVVFFVQNYKNIKFVLGGIDEKLLTPGISGILMDLGMSSMQVNNAERGFSVLSNGPLDMRMNPLVSLKAEDILNAWPDAEVGKVLREYGEESNWHHLQKKIVNARLNGGLHSTAELVDLIRRSTSHKRGGRQGWIKTATRVFQALRIAVNDELKTLQDSIYACFDSLASGGRLAVITFHSLEDRIVKQAFVNIVKCDRDRENGEDRTLCDPSEILVGTHEKEGWIRQMIRGQKATILTKRPITPSEKEEKLNPRSRSAKLRVIEKV